MVKNLRSFIHEKFPLELRVDLDILSRRRDINIKGKEKQEEILSLLRKYNVGDVVQLGPGTNRYGLKLDGFVVKIATDYEGKIDNLKEFKMAKILFPAVPKTYEVSMNGLLLVAEYINSFNSFTEMMRYADKIRAILTELSSVYLIGDVGITDKNFANWGLRVGTDEVVCLDFAYIYDVTSDLFVCRKCNTNTMLIPNKDFTALVCPNKACQKETSFEEIRSMISHEYHRDQIGDITEDGYLMTASDAMTELTESRSNYLVKKRPVKVKKRSYSRRESVLEEEKEEKEDLEMFKNEVTFEAKNITNLPNHPFRGLTLVGIPVEVVEAGTQAQTTTGIAHVEDLQVGDEVVTPDGSAAPVVSVQETVEESVSDDSGEVVFSGTIVTTPKKDRFKSKFCDESNRAVSILANKMADALREMDLFDCVQEYLTQKKVYAGDFYQAANRAIFKSIVEYLQFVEVEVMNPVSEGTHREFRAVYTLVNSDDYSEDRVNLLSTIERMYNTRAINSMETFSEMVDKYNEIYGVVSDFENGGTKYIPMAFPQEVIDTCVSKIAAKIPMGTKPIAIIKGSIEDLFYEGDEDGSDEKEDVVIIRSSEDEENDEVLDDESDEEYDDESGEDDEENANSYLTVEIYQDDDDDIIRIKSEDAFGEISIPIYGNMDNIDISSLSPKTVYQINGSWDWLTHMVPDMMFRTKQPTKYMNMNVPDDEIEEWTPHIVVLGKLNEDYIMGIFMIHGIYVVDDDFNYIDMFNPEVLKRMNKLIVDTIAGTSISHLNRSLQATELIYGEEELTKYFALNDDESEDEDGDEDVEEVYAEEVFDSGDEDADVEDQTDQSDDNTTDVQEMADEALSEAFEQSAPAPISTQSPKRDSKGRFVKADASDEDGVITPQRRGKRK